MHAFPLAKACGLMIVQAYMKKQPLQSDMNNGSALTPRMLLYCAGNLLNLPL